MPPKVAQPRPRRARMVRKVVDHSYTDHLHDPFCDEATERGKYSGVIGGVVEIFPEVLHRILSKTEHEEIVSWQPHGRSFCVRNKTKFMDCIIPKFFRQSKLSSFQRQLSLYGFIRITTGVDCGTIYHPLFLRGRKDLCSCMIRKKIKGIGSRAASSPRTEPNFYAMEPCPQDSGRYYSIMSSDDKNLSSSQKEYPHLDQFIINNTKSDILLESTSCVISSSEQLKTPHVDQYPRADETRSVANEFPYRSPATMTDECGMQDGERVYFAGRAFRYLNWER